MGDLTARSESGTLCIGFERRGRDPDSWLSVGSIIGSRSEENEFAKPSLPGSAFIIIVCAGPRNTAERTFSSLKSFL